MYSVEMSKKTSCLPVLIQPLYKMDESQPQFPGDNQKFLLKEANCV